MNTIPWLVAGGAPPSHYSPLNKVLSKNNTYFKFQDPSRTRASKWLLSFFLKSLGSKTETRRVNVPGNMVGNFLASWFGEHFLVHNRCDSIVVPATRSIPIFVWDFLIAYKIQSFCSCKDPISPLCYARLM